MQIIKVSDSHIVLCPIALDIDDENDWSLFAKQCGKEPLGGAWCGSPDMECTQCGILVGELVRCEQDKAMVKHVGVTKSLWVYDWQHMLKKDRSNVGAYT